MVCVGVLYINVLNRSLAFNVFCFSFQISVEFGKVPTIWKSSNVVPVPKINDDKHTDDLKPAKLTSPV